MKITDNTANVLREAQRRVSTGLEEIAPDIVSMVKMLVIVKSGDLQGSIGAEITDKKVTVGSPLGYAAKVERDNPYLRPALEANIRKLKRIFRA
ncbi:hypothetical protein LCGC14_1310770 [marine sediment metagenome]|uniref:HK97 gp10 family phage protein n=1 Tax=marine sediment metagenome TaxID=412755 RepID=A0A0F9NPY6_9ZZZZ